MEEYLEFAKQIAIKAGQIMLKYFKEDNGVKYKFDQTIVKKADTEINNYLINQVKEKYPTHSVDGEEEKFGAATRWMRNRRDRSRRENDTHVIDKI